MARGIEIFTGFLNLIRIQNLLIIAFTQYVVRFFVIYPIMKLREMNFREIGLLQPTEELRLQVSEPDFFLLSLSTIFIAAAGYIINDYFDSRIDRVNKPERLVIDRVIKRRVAMAAHLILNALGISIGLYLSHKSGILNVGLMIYLFAIIMLWFYSTNFKRDFLIGNIIVSLLSALVPILPGLFEIRALQINYGFLFEATGTDLQDMTRIIFFIAGFAFITSLIREIIKDMEDVEGDRKYGCRTMPIVLGIKGTKLIVIALILATMGLLGFLMKMMFEANDNKSFIYFLALLQVPFAFLTWRIFSSKVKKHFTFSSMIMKFIMLSGVSYFFLFSYLALNA